MLLILVLSRRKNIVSNIHIYDTLNSVSSLRHVFWFAKDRERSPVVSGQKH